MAAKDETRTSNVEKLYPQVKGLAEDYFKARRKGLTREQAAAAARASRRRGEIEDGERTEP